MSHKRKILQQVLIELGHEAPIKTIQDRMRELDEEASVSLIWKAKKEMKDKGYIEGTKDDTEPTFPLASLPPSETVVPSTRPGLTDELIACVSLARRLSELLGKDGAKRLIDAL